MMTDNRPYSKAWRITTLAVMGVCVSAFLGWDCVVATNPFRGDSISEISIWAALRTFSLPAIGGVFVGHLTWPGPERNPVWLVLVILIPIMLGLIAIDSLTWAGLIRAPWLMFLRGYPVLTLIATIPLGRFAWPQVRQ